MSNDAWKDQGMTTEEPFRYEDGEIVFREYEYPPKDPISNTIKLIRPAVREALVDALNKAYQQGWAESSAYYKENKI